MNGLREILFLQNIRGFGKVKINEILSIFSKDSICMEALIEECLSRKSIEKEELDYACNTSYKMVEDIDNENLNVITIFDDKYPKQLNDLSNKRPLLLYVKGNEQLLKEESMAIVGTREPSKFGQACEKQLVKKILELKSMPIVSGLALGCDAIAHKEVLRLKMKTIAILPSGFNNVSPSEHSELAKEIVESNGCLVTEYAPNMIVNKGYYIERDSLIAALASSVLAIECGEKSGTMHTIVAAHKMKRKIGGCFPKYVSEVYSRSMKNQWSRYYDGIDKIIRDYGGFEIKDDSSLNKFLETNDLNKNTEPIQYELRFDYEDI